MGYKKDDPCLAKAFPDERLFVLMTRDATAPKVVIEWIKENIGLQPAEKLHEALDCAIQMQKECVQMSQRKIYQLNDFVIDKQGAIHRINLENSATLIDDVMRHATEEEVRNYMMDLNEDF